MLFEIIVAVLLLGITRSIWRRWKYDLHKIPSRLELPFIGHAYVIPFTKGGLPKVVGNFYAMLGCPKVFKVSIFGLEVVWVTDIRFIKNVLMSRSDPFPRQTETRRLFTLMTGNNPNLRSLFNEAGLSPYVKAVRNVYAWAFHSDSLKDLVPTVQRLSRRMIDKVECKRQDGPINFQEICLQLTLDIIGEVAFETNLGGLDETSRLRQLIIEVGYIRYERRFNIFKILHTKLIPNSSVLKKQEDTIQALTDEWDALTKTILEYEDPPEGQEPMWNGLRKLVIPDTGERITFEQLRSEIANLIVAGTDSTGHQLAWTLGLLALHPDVVNRLLEELTSLRLHGPDARELTYEDLVRLTYLTAIVKEGMRLAAVIPSSFLRETKKDMTILGYRVPKGTAIAVPGNRSLYSETIWEDPLVFRPERWSTVDTSEKLFYGFSVGPRDCVGQKLAMIEMRVAIVEIVRRYRLSTNVTLHDLLNDVRIGLVIEAANGIWIDISPIE